MRVLGYANKYNDEGEWIMKLMQSWDFRGNYGTHQIRQSQQIHGCASFKNPDYHRILFKLVKFPYKQPKTICGSTSYIF